MIDCQTSCCGDKKCTRIRNCCSLVGRHLETEQPFLYEVFSLRYASDHPIYHGERGAAKLRYKVVVHAKVTQDLDPPARAQSSMTISTFDTAVL